MSTFVLIYFLYFCTLFKWLRAVKIYLHAKFQASSLKIERVILNFIFCAVPVPPPHVTNLPVELCASHQLITIWHNHPFQIQTPFSRNSRVNHYLTTKAISTLYFIKTSSSVGIYLDQIYTSQKLVKNSSSRTMESLGNSYYATKRLKNLS